jgi:DNA-binding winged helix-turn-helix (wHTH) protein
MPVEQGPPQAPVSIDSANAWVWQGGRRLDLAPKTFAVLRYLIERAGHLVTKEELRAAMWGETLVSEGAVVTCIRDIRKALGDTARTPRYVETIHRRGFRFIGPIATSPPVQGSRSGLRTPNSEL